MKKSLIIVCSCLVIAVVAVCILLGNLNGQKETSASLTERLDTEPKARAAAEETCPAGFQYSKDH